MSELLNRYVEVAFPLPLNQTFTYRWNFDEQNPIGYRVLVPFQSRLLTGYVLNESKKPSLDKIKDVQDVLDEIPVLTDELIELIRHISEKYGTSLGEALQTVIPTGLIKQTKKKIVPTDREDFPEEFAEQQLLMMIRKKKSIDWNTFKKNNAKLIPTLKKLEREDWITIESFLQKQRARDIKETIYSVKEDFNDILKGRKQIQVFETIRSQKVIALFSLKEIFGDKVGTILRTLEKKKIIEKKTRLVREQDEKKINPSPFELTAKQLETVSRIESAIKNNEQISILLHGVTGSGKTEVYLQATERCLNMGKNVLALVPEISLTPQFLARFQSRFGKQIALLHSQRSESERLFEWKRVLYGEARVVVGTRSSVFSPLKNIGLVILDEEHDRSYKQDDHVMYHAKDIALFRAKSENAVVLLGSATPAIETYHAAETQEIEKKILPNRIRQQDMPEVEIIDLRNEKKFGQQTMFSDRMKEEVESTLSRGKQVIIFLNRRGYSTNIFCPTCGKTLHCPNCSISMTFHQETDTFQCHYCDFVHTTDQECPSCQNNEWIRFGFGTERVQKELKFMFPDARVERMDRDTAKKGVFDSVFADFAQKKIDILIGTQMITKGLDFEHVDLVGVLLADQSLNFPDFRAAEQTFQLLTQVIGRAGRGDRRGKAILQTLQPEHYAITTAAAQDYQKFYEQEIEFRKQMAYPPFSKIVLFEIKGKKESTVVQMAQWLKKQIEAFKKDSILILGPSPAPIEKINQNFRHHLFLKSTEENEIERIAKWAYEKSREEFQKRDLILKFNLDPFDFM